MDKGWGLALDSSEFTSSPSNFFSNKKKAGNFEILDSSRRMLPAGIHFPVPSREQQSQDVVLQDANIMSSDDNHSHNPAEVDFFAQKNNMIDGHDGHGHDSENTIVHVKKESMHDLGLNTGLHLVTANTGSDQSTVDDGISSHAEDKRAKTELTQLQVELQRMNAENQKLREMLGQVSNNYTALQMHLVSLMQQRQQSHTVQGSQNQEAVEEKSGDQRHVQGLPRQFLDLGPSATVETDDKNSRSSSDERTPSGTILNNTEVASSRDQHSTRNDTDQDIGKRTGRDESPDSETQRWGPNKALKLDHDANKATDQSATEATMRKARVSVRARSEATMISDGCQWRKYGQKMAKGNPCPRAYYRCTMATGCPVRKQVQRCAEDRSILITTYEGNHNHPLPPAAMAMASTTTAAANMLLSGSMSSADELMNSNLLARAILPCSSSMATISASAPFPTVTLDLTQSPNPLQSQRPPSHAQFQVPFTGQIQQNFANQMPQIFGQPLYNQSKFSGLQLSSQAQGSHQMQQLSMADTVSAATAAITADPNFTAALAAAISSIIGGAHANNNNSSGANNINSTTNDTSYPGSN